MTISRCPTELKSCIDALLANRYNSGLRWEVWMATCEACEVEMDVDEFDVDIGDELSCPECGKNLRVARLSPIEFEELSEE